MVVGVCVTPTARGGGYIKRTSPTVEGANNPAGDTMSTLFYGSLRPCSG